MTTDSAIPSPPAFYREPLSIGTVPLVSRFNLAPLAGYTNLPFRLSIRELGGVGLCTTDLVNARAIVDGIQKTMILLATDPAERPLFVQIFGSKAHEMAGAAKWLVERKLADGIDINMGCPVRKVVKTGGIEWTIKDGIPFHAPTLAAEVREMVMKARQNRER